MNAGAMGIETFDQVVSVRYLDDGGELCEKSVSEIESHYRSVPEFEDNLVVSAKFKGATSTAEEISSAMQASKDKRKSSQPIAASAGCIFKNPSTELPAGMLVDQLGYKGREHGNARVSEVHGNFIVNGGGAKAKDVLGLISSIQEAAMQERGITLKTEVQIIGQDDPVGP